MVKSLEFVNLDLKELEHRKAFSKLMNDYMLDSMGLNERLEDEMAEKIMYGLEGQINYLGFLVKKENDYVGLANCFHGYSTFKAKQLINIHDFIVSPQYRKEGVGEFLINEISNYGKLNNYCRVTLEVRHDNLKAMGLYKKTGFKECNPPMYFWEKQL